MCVLVTQLCLTLCDPVHRSPPGSSVHGILQARILDWVVMPFSRVLIYVSIQITGFHAKQNVPSPGHLPKLKLRTFFHVDIWLFWKETFKILHSGVMSSHHIAKQLPWDKVSPVEGKRIITGCYVIHVKKRKKKKTNPTLYVRNTKEILRNCQLFSSPDILQRS